MSDPQPSPPIDVEQVIRAALLLMITGEVEPSVFTEEVTGYTPLGEVHGRDDLLAQVGDWRDGLTSGELVVNDIAMDGTTAMVTWKLAAHHTGEVLVNEDVLFAPTGGRVTLDVTTQFRFEGARICWFRHDYDLEDMLRQLRSEAGG